MINETEQFVCAFHATDFSGHDYAHIERVRKMALQIAATEGGDLLTIELAALLHDVADEKLGGTLSSVDAFLSGKVSDTRKQKILQIIDGMSFKGGDRPPLETLEGKIVQDADRLDAIGAIGVARTFQYGALTQAPMHVPGLRPRKPGDRTSPSSTINHFYEKLLLLKDLMNTETAKGIAEERHAFMVEFLERFQTEWEL
ncbi:phosphohydrolase [Exiguobacterium sp. N4-1P]|uniref:HD domain-containing protein n=1 Tax=Exiguobacterium sp. N4-1P TaxID=2051906 RepID=UPI000B5909DD|nr:HD domain-containing protein [Exiguobacterium sp. N4-1P]ASI34901.1 phosphohydrolase [Exiguobacterium sp. N4-1P]